MMETAVRGNSHATTAAEAEVQTVTSSLKEQRHQADTEKLVFGQKFSSGFICRTSNNSQ